MTIRNAVLGLAVVFGLSVWSWCRPCAKQALGAETPVVAAGAESGGNHDEAAARYRANQARHWRQVAIGH